MFPVTYLPEDMATAVRIEKLYDKAVATSAFTDEWRKEVRDWLLFHSRTYTHELLARARKARDKEGYVSHEEELAALARVDWPTAEPLLQSLTSGGPRTATRATSLLYQHAVETGKTTEMERYRARLLTTASARNAPARARDIAITALADTQWPGRDEWYLALFADETLRNAARGK